MKKHDSTTKGMFNNKISLVQLFFGHIGSIVMSLMVLLIVADVILRRFFNRPLSYSFELVELMLSVVFAGAVVVASLEARHVSIDIVVSQFPSKIRKGINKVMDLVSGILFVLIGWRGFLDGKDSQQINEMTGILEIHYFPFYFVLSICFMVSGIAMLVKILLNRSPGETR